MSETKHPVERLIETTVRLCEILLMENKLLAARRPRDLDTHRAEKETLSHAYQSEMEAVQNDPSVITAAPQKEVARWSDPCPSSKQLGLLSVFHKGGSGSSLFDVKPLGFDGSSGGFVWSVF